MDDSKPAAEAAPIEAAPPAAPVNASTDAEQVGDPEPAKRTRATAGRGGAAKGPSAGRGGARVPQFAPKDPLDGREPLEWQSNYTERAAKLGIWGEAAYLACLFIFVLVGMLLVWQRSPGGHFVDDVARVRLSQTMTNYMLAWIGGTLGGTLFSTKWLYHSVAKKMWHADRRLWRLFTPHLSGALAFATYVMMTCGLFPIVEKKSLETDAMALSFGFIVGLFSDSASAKLAEVAETLFGSNKK